VQGNVHARFGEGRLEKGHYGTSLAAYSTTAANVDLLRLRVLHAV
jgi:hypothetical protein